MEKYDDKVIKELTSYLTLDNLFIVLRKSKFEGLNKTEKIYNTDYSIEEIPQEYKDSLRKFDLSEEDKKLIHLPRENIFIAENFDIKSEQTL